MAEVITNLKTATGHGLPLGVTKTENGIQFSISYEKKEDLFLNIYFKDGSKMRILMQPHHVFGNIYSVTVEKIKDKYFEYSYDNGSAAVKDPYASYIADAGVWGEPSEKTRYGFWTRRFDWKDDQFLHIPMHELIIYKLHVRGFTNHPSSGVRHKGTFKGVSEKIDYLKRLGINCVELMPVVDFDEMELQNKIPYNVPEKADRQYKMNFWGYGKGYYFAPKKAFSAGENPVNEFKNLVKDLHAAGIEVILEMHFPFNANQTMVMDCLRHWVLEYHVDGFHVNSNATPVNILAKDPVLARTKLLSEGFNLREIYGEKLAPFKHLAEYHDNYLVCGRRFLKGDEDMVKSFSKALIENDKNMSSVRYLSNHNGFRLMDMVSFDEKHNEANGENNKDGTEYNYSWNCGAEGVTRKRKVNELRKRQLKNAALFSLIHQGIPVIYAGDEFGQSQDGNNNVYCQDNELSWVNWRNLKKNNEYFEFVQKVLELRKAHPVLHQEKAVRMMDYLSCGYPDISFHGSKPWKVEETPASRYLGVLYCGQYAHDCGKDDDFFYFAYNMHWEPKNIGLPMLPPKLEWGTAMTTWQGSESCCDEEAMVQIPPRTITIFKSVPKTVKAVVSKVKLEGEEV